MIAMTAEPFKTTGVNPKVYERNGPSLHEGQTMFKPVRQVPRFRSALKSQGECGEFAESKNFSRLERTFSTEFLFREGVLAASECKTLAKDFWSRGYNRWVVGFHRSLSLSLSCHFELQNR